MVSLDIATVGPNRVEIRRSGPGRFLDAVLGFLGGAALAAAGGGLFYGIDRVGREAAGVEVPQGYLLAVVVLGVLAGVVAVVWSLMRQRRWIFDAEADVIALQWDRPAGKTHVIEVPLSELREVRLDAARIGSKSSVVLVFDDGEEEVVISRLGSAQVEPVHRAIGDLLRR